MLIQFRPYEKIDYEMVLSIKERERQSEQDHPVIEIITSGSLITLFPLPREFDSLKQQVTWLKTDKLRIDQLEQLASLDTIEVKRTLI